MTTPAKPNPLLELPAMAELLALPEPERRALAALLSELGTQAHTKAEVSWRQRKGPMAAYWRAVGVYAGHTARALRRGPQVAPAPAPHHRAQLTAEARQRILAMEPSPAKYAAMVREGLA
jgi:hypothetical protein